MSVHLRFNYGFAHRISHNTYLVAIPQSKRFFSFLLATVNFTLGRYFQIFAEFLIFLMVNTSDTAIIRQIFITTAACWF